MKKAESKSREIKLILSLVKKLNEKEREELFSYLRKEKFNSILKSLKSSIGDIPLSYEEITEEVEIVREEMYRNKKKN